jgi:hypothetical protein
MAKRPLNTHTNNIYIASAPAATASGFLQIPLSQLPPAGHTRTMRGSSSTGAIAIGT